MDLFILVHFDWGSVPGNNSNSNKIILFHYPMRLQKGDTQHIAKKAKDVEFVYL